MRYEIEVLHGYSHTLKVYGWVIYEFREIRDNVKSKQMVACKPAKFDYDDTLRTPEQAVEDALDNIDDEGNVKKNHLPVHNLGCKV